MEQVIRSPGKYIQGAGITHKLATYLSPLGDRFLVIGDEFVLGLVENMISSSFSSEKLHLEVAVFQGECSQNEIERLQRIAKAASCNVIVGIGGGKTLDTAKALAHFMSLPVAIVPTIASTDAPCSALSVIYSDNGEFERYLLLPSNPNTVLVDTQIVAAAPSRLLGKVRTSP